jgi:alpha-amylase
VTTTFEENATTVWGENVFVVGNTPALGDWDPARAVALSSAAYPVWRGSVTLPPGVPLQYKYLKKNGGQVIWESDPNRARTTPASAPCTATWTDSWR